MIESMTGYGKAVAFCQNKKLTVEIKSINSKQLDLVLRIPNLFREQENIIRNLISPEIERGKIDLTVSIDHISYCSNLTINSELLKDYKSQIENLAQELNIKTPEDWLGFLFRLPDAWISTTAEVDPEETNLLMQACNEAVQNLHFSRLQEGEKLYNFFLAKISRIRTLLAQIDNFENARIDKLKERLEKQLLKLESIEYDKGRLEQELIYYIEKLDVTEEKVRLQSHLNYFEDTLGDKNENNTGGKGKKLGFIAQEMGREINTLGSKANDADMQRLVVMMKDELEQIKEQVLNVL